MTPRIVHLIQHTPLPGYDYTLDLMRTLLAHAGLTLDHVVYWTTPEEVGVKLAELQPNVVVLWEQHGHMLRGLGVGAKRPLDDWKGFVWKAEAVCPGVKCIATYAPARVKVEWGLTGVVKFHLQKAAREALSPLLETPVRNIGLALPTRGYAAQNVVNGLRLLRAKQQPLAVDIEGGCGMGPACIGFAWHARDAFVVPIHDVDGVSLWSEEDEVLIWTAVQDLLEDPLVPKIIQNGLFEMFVLAWTTGIVVAGLQDDTMLKHWELYCELEKSLEFQASIYTSQPFWKLDHKVVDGRYVPFKDGRRATTEEWFIYNGTDCCVTYEVNQVMEARLLPKQREHYRANVELLAPTAYMSLRGMRYDAAKAKERLAETQTRIYELQDEINREAAKSPSRIHLRTFYAALGGERHQLPSAGGVCEGEVPDDRGANAKGAGQHLQALIPFLVEAFCCCERDRKEKREVEETTWQPMWWNGKRWVKKGKRLKEPNYPGAAVEIHSEEDPGCPIDDHPDYTVWLKPVRKLVTRNIPVEIKTLKDVRRFALPSRRGDCRIALDIVKQADNGSASGGLTASQRGELSTLLGTHVNLNSTGRSKDGSERDANWFVYEHCGAPRQFKKEHGRNTDRLTSSNEAVLLAYIATSDPRLATFMAWRAADTRREALEVETDHDGRIRCSYTLPGTDTGRLSCGTSVTGSGYNLQTVTEDLRDLFPAEEGCDFGQFDLRGADGWTLAAECARYGDTTMLEDLQAGLKPVNIIVLLYTEGVHINQLSREELKVAQKRVAKESWQYIATKPIFYGYSYLMGARKMSNGIAEDSYAETGTAVVVPPRKCEEIMRMIDVRYPGIRRWQEGSGRAMVQTGILHSTVGWQRRFFGRKVDVKHRGRPDRTTHGAWLGTLPQFNTTWATKMGLKRLWEDPENRRSDGSLRIEPLHTVHDSLNTQWKVEDREFARRKVLPEWFNKVPFNVAGLELVIPASGTYGVNWKEQTETL